MAGCDSGTAGSGAAAESIGTLVLERVVGVVDGDPDYQFSEISVILPTENGDLWVLDGGRDSPQMALRVYDSTAVFLRRVGGVGDGPGEYRRADALGELGDGRVVLRDAAFANRFNVYEADGTIAPSWSFGAPIPWISGGIRFVVDTAGVVWTPFSERFGRARGPDRENQPTLWIRIGTDGAVIDTITPPERPVVDEQRVTIVNGISTFSFLAPFAPRGVLVLGRTGEFITARTDEYRLSVHPGPSTENPQGPRVITRDVPPVMLSDEEHADWTADLEARIAGREGQVTGPVPEIHRTKPYFDGITVGLDGDLWVKVRVPSVRFDPPPPEDPEARAPVPWAEPEVYDVLAPDGTFRGRVSFPDRDEFIPYAFRGDRVWGISLDELGVQTIRRYRVEW